MSNDKSDATFHGTGESYEDITRKFRDYAATPSRIAPPVVPGPIIPGRTTPQVPPPWPPLGHQSARPSDREAAYTGQGPAAQHGWSGKKKKRNWGAAAIAIGVGVMFVLCVIGAAAVSSSDQSEPKATGVTASTGTGEDIGGAAGKATTGAGQRATKAPVAEPPADTVAYKAGITFRVGDFQTTIHGQKCGIEQVGTQYLNTKAKGSFCRIDLTAKNVTKAPHFYDVDMTLTAYDAQGRKFNTDSTASIYGNKDGNGFFEELNPDTSVRAFAFVDLPQGVKIDHLVFSAGVFTTAPDITVTF